MANHAYVKTKKVMNPQRVTEVLNSLNKRYFKNNLQIEYSNEVGNELAWGPHVWIIKYISSVDGEEYGARCMWLNTSRSFEIRHGGGGDFIWWIDQTITNEIALVFNGYRYDDATGLENKEKGIPNRYSTLKKYLKKRFNVSKEGLGLRYCFQSLMKEFVPPEFKIDSGNPVEVIHEKDGSYSYKEIKK